MANINVQFGPHAFWFTLGYERYNGEEEEELTAAEQLQQAAEALGVFAECEDTQVAMLAQEANRATKALAAALAAYYDDHQTDGA